MKPIARGSRVLILGSGDVASKLMEEIEAAGDQGTVVVGMVDEHPPDEPLRSKLEWLGSFDRLTEIVDDVRANHIVVALRDRRGHLPLDALLESRVRGVVVEDALEFRERLTGKMAIEALTPGPLILSKGFRTSTASEAIARAVGLVAAVVGFVLLAPLLALIALAIKLDSKGPVVFVQARAGKNGRPFNLLKFRTMHPCEERVSEWAQDNSSRITRVGRVLRRFRCDEWLQLVNIVRGEMNLVGPRPHPTCNHEIFLKNIPYYSLRSSVRPGVTGWAQVRYGYANNIEEETEKMRYDLYYIKNRSLRLDARILVDTVRIILAGHESSRVASRDSELDVDGAIQGDSVRLSPVPVNLDPLARES